MALPSSCAPGAKPYFYSIPNSVARMPNDREARLKREFAPLYPGLRSGVWYKAAWLSARQFARVRCDGRASSMASVVNESHFEFRGGKPRRKRGPAAAKPR